MMSSSSARSIQSAGETSGETIKELGMTDTNNAKRSFKHHHHHHQEEDDNDDESPTTGTGTQAVKVTSKSILAQHLEQQQEPEQEPNPTLSPTDNEDRPFDTNTGTNAHVHVHAEGGDEIDKDEEEDDYENESDIEDARLKLTVEPKAFHRRNSNIDESDNDNENGNGSRTEIQNDKERSSYRSFQKDDVDARIITDETNQDDKKNNLSKKNRRSSNESSTSKKDHHHPLKALRVSSLVKVGATNEAANATAAAANASPSPTRKIKRRSKASLEDGAAPPLSTSQTITTPSLTETATTKVATPYIKSASRRRRTRSKDPASMNQQQQHHHHHRSKSPTGNLNNSHRQVHLYRRRSRSTDAATIMAAATKTPSPDEDQNDPSNASIGNKMSIPPQEHYSKSTNHLEYHEEDPLQDQQHLTPNQDDVLRKTIQRSKSTSSTSSNRVGRPRIQSKVTSTSSTMTTSKMTDSSRSTPNHRSTGDLDFHHHEDYQHESHHRHNNKLSSTGAAVRSRVRSKAAIAAAATTTTKMGAKVKVKGKSSKQSVDRTLDDDPSDTMMRQQSRRRQSNQKSRSLSRDAESSRRRREKKGNDDDDNNINNNNDVTESRSGNSTRRRVRPTHLQSQSEQQQQRRSHRSRSRDAASHVHKSKSPSRRHRHRSVTGTPTTTITSAPNKNRPDPKGTKISDQVKGSVRTSTSIAPSGDVHKSPSVSRRPLPSTTTSATAGLALAPAPLEEGTTIERQTNSSIHQRHSRTPNDSSRQIKSKKEDENENATEIEVESEEEEENHSLKNYQTTTQATRRSSNPDVSRHKDYSDDSKSSTSHQRRSKTSSDMHTTGAGGSMGTNLGRPNTHRVDGSFGQASRRSFDSPNMRGSPRKSVSTKSSGSRKGISRISSPQGGNANRVYGSPKSASTSRRSTASRRLSAISVGAPPLGIDDGDADDHATTQVIDKSPHTLGDPASSLHSQSEPKPSSMRSDNSNPEKPSSIRSTSNKDRPNRSVLKDIAKEITKSQASPSPTLSQHLIKSEQSERRRASDFGSSRPFHKKELSLEDLLEGNDETVSGSKDSSSFGLHLGKAMDWPGASAPDMGLVLDQPSIASSPAKSSSDKESALLHRPLNHRFGTRLGKHLGMQSAGNIFTAMDASGKGNNDSFSDVGSFGSGLSGSASRRNGLQKSHSAGDVTKFLEHRSLSGTSRTMVRRGRKPPSRRSTQDATSAVIQPMPADVAAMTTNASNSGAVKVIRATNRHFSTKFVNGSDFLQNTKYDDDGCEDDTTRYSDGDEQEYLQLCLPSSATTITTTATSESVSEIGSPMIQKPHEQQSSSQGGVGIFQRLRASGIQTPTSSRKPVMMSPFARQRRGHKPPNRKQSMEKHLLSDDTTH